MNIKKEDRVIVITGKERGKKGRVIKAIPESNRVIVEQVNLIKKSMKPSRQFQQGGIIDKEAPLHISNVMLVCPGCNRPSGTGTMMLDTGKKVRICKKCKEIIQ